MATAAAEVGAVKLHDWRRAQRPAVELQAAGPVGFAGPIDPW